MLRNRLKSGLHRIHIKNRFNKILLKFLNIATKSFVGRLIYRVDGKF